MIKIGLKANAAFLFEQMQGDTLGGTEGQPYWRCIIHLTKQQFTKFKRVIAAFDGDVNKSLYLSDIDGINYECYFKKTK